MSKSDRFQNQPFYIQLWRCRWYFKIPLDAINFFLYADEEMTLKQSFSLAKGIAHVKMNWVYSLQEAKLFLSNKRKK